MGLVQFIKKVNKFGYSIFFSYLCIVKQKTLWFMVDEYDDYLDESLYDDYEEDYDDSIFDDDWDY